MKIEKISKNKIRCTLTSEDLAERKIKISELAYGSEKAKKLFRDMLEQAAIECDFESDEMPIMVEAIPTSKDSLVLYITKVENPDEFDTRFSDFTPAEVPAEEQDAVPEEDIFSGTALESMDDNTKNAIKNIVSRFKEKYGDNAEVYLDSNKKTESQPQPQIINRAFIFDNVEALTRYAAIASHNYKGTSMLFREPADGRYFLVLSTKNTQPAQFTNACNVACEFAGEVRNANLSYYTEHYKCIIKNDAIGVLSVFM